MSDFAAPDAQDSVIAAELAAEGYENVTVIGRGGFGVVFRGFQRALERTVAVKVLTADLHATNVERFLREQRAMGRLSGHPNIVNIFHFGTTGSGRPYIVMQYHPQGSLESRIRRRGPLAWREALALGVKVAGALETAHRLGTLHRDVKPANILLTDYGEPQLTDFGIAHITGGFETSTGTIIGSPAYTAPEVLQGQPPTPASDVYSLAATLFCAITGHAAFERRSGEQVVAQFLRITSQPIPDLREAGIPTDVSAAIEDAMSGRPSDRPATAVEFGDELRRAEGRNDLVVVDMAIPAELVAEAGDDLPGGGATQAERPADLRARPTPAYSVHAGVGRTPITPSTKYRPPSPNRPLVTRRRLVDALRIGQGRHLTVIHAPAGYGKTTLATQWRDILMEEGVAVAWLSVDPDDNNVVWFLSHLVEAIRQVRVTLAEELGQALEEHGNQAERYVLSTLINEIDRSGESVGVVIDDWHRVTSKETRAALGFLLDNCCHHLHIIVTSRTRSGLPLSRMKVRNELLEIDSVELRFDLTETRTFLVDLGGLSLGQRDVEDLTDSTDGWVAALQLASLSLRGCDDPTRMISHLSGRHQAIGEFLAENVLDTLDADVLDFLMATSITGRVCGELASVLARVPNGQGRLEGIEQCDLFLRRIDDEGEWFRYHHLFAEYLRRRLERDQPDRIEGLHRTASVWFAEHQLLGEAVDHALAAGDEQWAVQLVERDGTYLLEHSQMSTLLGLVAKLPPLAVADSPRLQVEVAWANILLHRSTPAQRALDHLSVSLDRSGFTESEREDIRVEAGVAAGVLEIYADRIAGGELFGEALARPDTLRPWVVSVAANVATFVEIYRFDFAAAQRIQDWVRTYHDRTNGPFSVMYGYAFAGIAAYEQLELAVAEDQFTNALRVARQAGGTHSHAARLAGALLGELRYEQGNLDEAERLIDEGYKLGSEGGVVDFMIARYVIGARIKALQGDRETATRYLQEGSRTADFLSLDRLRARIANERMILGLPTKSVSAGSPRGAPDSGMHGIGRVTAQIEDDTAIRLLLAEDAPQHATRACMSAQQWVNDLEGTGRRRAALHATRLLAACLAAAGRIDEAKSALAEVAAICAERGLNRFLLDGGSHTTALLLALRDDQRAGRWRSNWTPVSVTFLEAMSTAVPTMDT
ncbi:serine/threonine-protein kinase [Rhodococcus opacus]|uniref:serine/threonine-protein kinase n=1 Tax=Rhodococcus opacus TaxID=37919 RepID=UPI001C44AF2C|nr:serine/threonine-protein kinase [Rhodococcus opacus]MBV6756894.1 protein kinase [Rhodococcus opacus]